MVEQENKEAGGNLCAFLVSMQCLCDGAPLPLSSTYQCLLFKKQSCLIPHEPEKEGIKMLL